MGGVTTTDSGRKNWGSSTSFRRRRRREKFLSTFFEIFGKFVNKNAIKIDFWVICVEVSRKFSKKSPILGKKYFSTGPKFQSISPLVPSPPPQKSLCFQSPVHFPFFRRDGGG